MDRDALIDALVDRGAASRAQLEKASRDLSGKALVDALVAEGCPPRQVAAAVCAVTGLREAPRSALLRPKLPPGLGVKPETWLELRAAPFDVEDDGSLAVAVTDPSVEVDLLTLDAPIPQLYVATAGEIEVALKRAFPGLADPDGETRLAPPTGPSPSEIRNAVPLDDEEAPRIGNDLPTVGLPALSDKDDDGFAEPPVTDAPVVVTRDDFNVPPTIASDELPPGFDDADDEDDDFDGPTQAVDPSAFLPQLASGLNAEALEDDEALAPPPADDDDDDGDFEPKTVAMSAHEMRQQLKAIGAVPRSQPDAEALIDAEEDAATLTLSKTEMRAALGRDKSDARVAFADTEGHAAAQTDLRPSMEVSADLEEDDILADVEAPAGRNPALLEPTGGTDEHNFDYSAAADEFDDGEGRELIATSASQAEATDEPARAIALDATDPSPGRDAAQEGDDFDESTLAAPLSDTGAAAEARGAPSPSMASSPTGSDEAEELSLQDDGVVAISDEDPFEESTQAAFERMLNAGDSSASVVTPARPIQLNDEDSDIFVGPVSDELPTQLPADPVAATRLSEDEERSAATQDGRGLRTEALPALSADDDDDDDLEVLDDDDDLVVVPTGDDDDDDDVFGADDHGDSGVDTGPTGPVAISGYEVRDVLGAGGMATVYRALQKSADREVALKILSPHLANDTAFVARFQREIRSSVALTHANIIRTYDYGDEQGIYYMATEVMDGGSLREVLQEHGRLPLALAVKFAEHLLRGIGHAHRRSMVHRDIKPANLMLSSDGYLKIGDFGIAKSETDENLTKTGALFGTPAYMSPEQALGRPVDARSDLFSCGIILYELLTGDNPYQAETASAALLKVSRADPPPILLENPVVPTLLLDVVQRLQTRDADERYQTAEQALDDLEPMIEQIDSHHDEVIATFLADREGTMRMLDDAHAELELRRGRAALRQSPPQKHVGGTALFLASRLAPNNEEISETLQRASKTHELSFGRTMDSRIHDAERSLQDDPHAPGLLRRISDLYKADGNPFKSAVYLREYLRVKPTDSHAQNQLRLMLGDHPLGGYTAGAGDDGGPGQLGEADIEEALDWSSIGMPGDDVTQLPPEDDATAEPMSATAQASDDADYDADSGGGGAAGLFYKPPEDVRPAQSQGDASEMLRQAAARARGGLQVVDAGPTPKGPPGATGADPLVGTPQAPKLDLPDWGEAGGPRGPAPTSSKPPPPVPGQSKPAPKGLIAAAVGAVIVLLLIGVGVWRFASFESSIDVSDVDPGGPTVARQAAMMSFAEARLEEGDPKSAAAALSYLIEIDGSTQAALQALIRRGVARAEAGDTEGAKADFRTVTERFPPDNFLHMEAKKRLDALE